MKKLVFLYFLHESQTNENELEVSSDLYLGFLVKLLHSTTCNQDG